MKCINCQSVAIDVKVAPVISGFAPCKLQVRLPGQCEVFESLTHERQCNKFAEVDADELEARRIWWRAKAAT